MSVAKKTASVKKTKKADAAPAALDPQLLRRVVVEGVTPEVDEGRYPAKRTAGEAVVVEADVFADGHDVLAAVVLWRKAGDSRWREAPMAPLGNDRWRGSFTAAVEYATYEFTVEGWVDRVATWQYGLDKKIAAGQDVSSERLEKKLLPKDRGRSAATRYGRVLTVIAERERARFGAWYEMFPRSAGPDPSRSATFKEAEAMLPYIASMGFDVVYLPPIHPIGPIRPMLPPSSPPAQLPPALTRNRYSPDSTTTLSSLALRAPIPIAGKFASGVPPSVTSAVSGTGSTISAVVFPGIFTSISRSPPTFFHETSMRPRGLSSSSPSST